MIWRHPNNQRLANTRDPNLLYPGDEIFIPDVIPKTTTHETDQPHTFLVKKTLDEFFLTVQDSDGNPIRNESYTLDLGGRTYHGTTDNDGGMHIADLDAAPGGGCLVFPNHGLILQLQLGQMNPGHSVSQSETPLYDNGVSGIQMRLTNLGYDPGEADGILGPRTRAAVSKFQVFELGRDPESAIGDLDEDTRNAILAAHRS
jgi:N-acetylmuramoyl-L-alanine amidase